MEKGTELQGKYMILRQLGEGGEGKTYLAYDEQANRNVAVRECGEKPSESRLAAWQKMIDIGKLPGIAQIYEVWETEGVFYMALEYAEGKNGVEYLESHPQGMEPAQALRMMAPVAEGLSALHDKGMLHRDISTDNLLIKGDGSALLCDPGLLCETQGEPDPVNRVKNGFSPMEMYLGDGRQGTWSDVYEYCATLCHLMTGQVLPAPAMRKGEDPFAGKRINLPAASLDLLRAGLEVEWERRLRSVKPFCQTGMQDGAAAQTAPDANRNIQSAQPAEVVQVTDVEQPPYVAQPQMRTMPVNTQNVMSLQPDNAMNAGRRKSRGDGGRIFGAVGIVALLLAIIVGGFAFYQAKNDEDSDVAEEEEKKDKKKDDGDDDGDDSGDEDSEDDSEDEDEEKEVTARVEGDGAISWDELIERYKEYLETNTSGRFDSFKLVDIDDDELPECFMAGQIFGIDGILYYNQKEDEVVYADSDYTGGFVLERGNQVRYAEEENIFVMDNLEKHSYANGGDFLIGAESFFSFGTDGKVERVGETFLNYAVEDGKAYGQTYSIGIGTNRQAQKAEYEEYISDFGELNDHFDYQDMYVSLDKAYEKYLEGK